MSEKAATGCGGVNRNWDSIIAADDVKDVNAGLAKTELGLLGIVVAEFARDAMKVLKERKW